MTRPTKYLNRIILFLTAVIIVLVLLFPGMQQAFVTNIALNGVIATVLLIGIVFSIRQVMMLSPAVKWIREFQKEDQMEPLGTPPSLLSPMAAMMGEDNRRKSLSAVSMRTILDGIAARMDESREITRYLICLLIFLGLLGTFWGLLGTISSIRETIDSLTVGSGDITHLFEDLKQGLSAPLGGMGTAFSSSLFGLAGSVILGFVDLQTGQAQSRFFNDLEDWLSGITKLSRGGGITLEGEADAAAVPAYVSALLEQTADSLDNLHKVISRSEEKRAEVNTALINLSGQISAMTDSQNENTAVLHRLVDVLTPQKDEDKDKTTATHLRNIDVQMKHLLEETVRGNTQLTDDLRAEFKLLARTLGAILDGRPHPATPEPSEPAPRPAKKPAEMDYEMPEPKPKADKKPIITPRPLRAKRDDD